MTSRISRALKKRLIAVVIVVSVLLWVFFRTRAEPDLLAIRFVGFTNYPGQTHPTALFATTNHSDTALGITTLVEVKTADWPIYGPDMQPMYHDWPDLRPHQATILPIPVPDYGSAWRLRVICAEALTAWDRRRSAWAASLHTRKLHAAGRVVWRGKKSREMTTPEMKR